MVQFDDPRCLVESNYDQIASNYFRWTTEKKEDTPRLVYLTKFLAHLTNPATARILEIGCGAGVPGTQALAGHVKAVVANDISQAMLELARKHVESANVDFVHGDASKLDIPPESFDGVLGFYSIIHLPRDDQRPLFRQIAEWLRPGGLLLCNLSTLNSPSAVEEWLGGKMFWSGFDQETNEAMVTDAGFELLESKMIEEDEDGRMVFFQWLLARKRSVQSDV